MKDKPCILVVDDDPNISRLEQLYLEKENYEVKVAADGNEAIDSFRKMPPDLVLLDVMLPGTDGYEVLKTIRKSGSIPVIMVTAKGETFDKVLCLELGADDYIVKPFNPAELVARVKAHIRIHEMLLDQSNEKEEIVYRDLVISVPYRKVTVRGNDIYLKNREYEVLYYLASHPGVVFSREKLYEELWGQEVR